MGPWSHIAARVRSTRTVGVVELRNQLIAIVDDDASLLTSLARNLRIAGYEVKAFGSAEEFLACEPLLRPNLLLADLRMPGIGGIELSLELGRRGVCAPVLFMTGHSQQETTRELASAGATQCLRKPFDAKELRTAIEVALRQAS
jgi:FixJ family two-component response regulator